MKALAAFALGVVVIATGCARPETPGAASAPTPTVVEVTPTSASAVVPVVPRLPGERRSAVRMGNQHPLNEAAVPFAKYVNAMHNRIHPLFTDEALHKIDALGPNHPLNNMSLMTRVELMIDGKSGDLVKQTVVGTSGIAAFDELAIEALRRAAPFGPAEAPLWSSDGNVYIHWEFRRDPILGCSVWHVRPFLLDIWSAPRTTP